MLAMAALRPPRFGDGVRRAARAERALLQRRGALLHRHGAAGRRRAAANGFAWMRMDISDRALVARARTRPSTAATRSAAETLDFRERLLRTGGGRATRLAAQRPGARALPAGQPARSVAAQLPSRRLRLRVLPQPADLFRSTATPAPRGAGAARAFARPRRPDFRRPGRSQPADARRARQIAGVPLAFAFHAPDAVRAARAGRAGVLGIGLCRAGRVPPGPRRPAPLPRIGPGRHPPRAPAPPAAAHRTPLRRKPAAMRSQRIAAAPCGHGRPLADAGRRQRAACEQYRRRNAGPSADAYYLLGVLHDAAGHVADAHAAYRKTVYLDPGHREALPPPCRPARNARAMPTAPPACCERAQRHARMSHG